MNCRSLTLLALAGLLGLVACTGDAADKPALLSTAPAAADTPGHAVDPELWAMLSAELERVLAAEGTAKRSSEVSTGAGSAVGDFELYSSDEGIAVAGWSYRNQGDYDLNGVVTIADLTPIGLNYGRKFSDPEWQVAQFADGDNNGEVNIGDVTPIGQNFGGQVDGFELQTLNLLDPEAEYEAEFQVPRMIADPGSGNYPYYEMPVDASTGAVVFRVVPYAEVNDEFSYGPESNHFITGQNADPWPEIYASNQRTGRSRSTGPLQASLHWSRVVEGGAFILTSPVADNNNQIYIGTMTEGGLGSVQNSKGRFYCYDLNGELKWSYATAAGLIGVAGISEQGRVIFGDAGGRAYALTPDGKQIWRTSIGSPVAVASVTFDQNEAIYLNCADITGQTGLLVRLGANGVPEWNRTSESSSAVPSIIDPLNRVLFNTNFSDFTFYDFMGNDSGTVNLSLTFDGLGHPALVGFNIITASSGSPSRVTVRPIGAGMLLDIPIGGEMGRGPAITSDGNIVVSNLENEQEYLQLVGQDGTIHWSMPLPFKPISSITIDSENRMYFCAARIFGETATTSMVCILPSQSIAWEYDMEGRATLYPIIAGDGMLLYVIFSQGTDGDGTATELVMLREAPV